MIILLSISCVNAIENDTDNVITINNENDNLTADIGTYTELEQVFLNNDKFVFEKDYAANSKDGIINLKRSIEIDGQGHSIDAGGYTGILQADSSQSNKIKVVLKNIIFKNAKSGDGGAIIVKSAKNVNIKIIDCTFLNNHVNEDGGAIYYDSTGTLEIINSKFDGNVQNTVECITVMVVQSICREVPSKLKNHHF